MTDDQAYQRFTAVARGPVDREQFLLVLHRYADDVFFSRQQSDKNSHLKARSWIDAKNEVLSVLIDTYQMQACRKLPLDWTALASFVITRDRWLSWVTFLAKSHGVGL